MDAAALLCDPFASVMGVHVIKQALATPMAMLRIELLGGLELIGADGAPISISARKVAALAAYLAVVRRPQGRDALAAMFWGDRAEEQPA